MKDREVFDAWFDPFALRTEDKKFGLEVCAWTIWQAAIQHEREACAKVCEMVPSLLGDDIARCAAAIRARGQ